MIEILCDDSTSCKEACDNNDYHRSRQRQTWVLNQWEIVWTISFIVFSCKNVKLSFLFVALYLALYAQYEKYVQKVINNICNNSPWAW